MAAKLPLLRGRAKDMLFHIPDRELERLEHELVHVLVTRKKLPLLRLMLRSVTLHREKFSDEDRKRDEGTKPDERRRTTRRGKANKKKQVYSKAEEGENGKSRRPQVRAEDYVSDREDA